eukprot:NODE_5753_length_1738_cov_4.623215.p2 GENE.NODE_5753_length_1738_cov_4.623215~~NODE_5753_length_1738_cov_4.623215.p2  ORF type:complete len:174 (+),score=37.67 NODE_5753_length_1738_cov_4.623215:229-750(+)
MRWLCDVDYYCRTRLTAQGRKFVQDPNAAHSLARHRGLDDIRRTAQRAGTAVQGLELAAGGDGGMALLKHEVLSDGSTVRGNVGDIAISSAVEITLTAGMLKTLFVCEGMDAGVRPVAAMPAPLAAFAVGSVAAVAGCIEAGGSNCRITPRDHESAVGIMVHEGERSIAKDDH